MLCSMTDSGAVPNHPSDPSSSSSPGQQHPASFARHDVDVNAPDDARGGHEQASFDRHDVEVDAPDAVVETEEGTFDRHDVDVDAADSVHEAPTFDRRDKNE